MVVEPHILRRYQRIDKSRREIRVLNTYAILIAVIASQGLQVRRNNLAREGVFRVLQFLQGGKITQHTAGNEP